MFILLLGITACRSNGNTAIEIAAAEQAIAECDYALARSICETITTDSTTTLNVDELCRLSLIYMKMSDIEDSDINTAAATQCYRNALKIDKDSARLFYDNVPIDEARHVEIMSQLDRILSSSRDIYIDDDSINAELLDSLINIEYSYSNE